MQSTMNFNGLQSQGIQDNYILDNVPKKKTSLWSRPSLRRISDRRRQNTSSQPRACKPKPTHSNSLIDYSDPQRTQIILEKQDNETFGFEIQTYGLQQRNSSAVEMMETVCGNIVKQIELEKKMNVLKQSLREKLIELQALTLQEKRLMRGNLNDSSFNLSMDSCLNSPTSRRYGRRFSSDSSCRSVMTDDSDQASVFGDLCSPSPCSAASTTDDSCFFSRDFPSQDNSGRFSSSSSNHHQPLSRSSSSSFAGSSSSLSPSWEETRISSLFGTLPRKARRGSVRKHILKLIPGLQRSVEEEDMGTNIQ
ncbi:hypothetical protein INR49_005328 [Caranx melampygus]|nr:hypothetical protein INR49_005328 [Caranx melampygus]